MNQAPLQPLILAVDDEASNLQLLRHILQDHYRLLLRIDRRLSQGVKCLMDIPPASIWARWACNTISTTKQI